MTISGGSLSDRQIEWYSKGVNEQLVYMEMYQKLKTIDLYGHCTGI